MSSRTSTCSRGLTRSRTSPCPSSSTGSTPELDAVGQGLKALEELDVADRADRYPDELSGGERQRVAIARAIAVSAGCCRRRADGALDSVNGEAVMRLLRPPPTGVVAGVVVTHEAHLASWADRVVFLRDGHVVDQTVPPPARSRSSRPVTGTDDRRLTFSAGGAGKRRRAARRAIVRWAWRMFRREWRQQIVVLALLAVAVAAAISSVTIASTRAGGRRRVRLCHTSCGSTEPIREHSLWNFEQPGKRSGRPR